MELVELYKKYVDRNCEIAIKAWDGSDRLFWHHGIVKSIDEGSLYIEETKANGFLERIALNDIVKIKVMA